MPEENLLKYIRDGLAMGRTEDILRPLLARAGWTDKDVDDAFQAIHGGTAAGSAQPTPVQPAQSVQPQATAHPSLQSYLPQTSTLLSHDPTGLQPRPRAEQPQPQVQVKPQPQVQVQSQAQPQAHSQPQVQPMRQEPGPQPSAPAMPNMKWIAAGVLAVVIVGGGAWAAYAMFGTPSPQQVLDGVFQKGLTQVTSFNDDTVVSADVTWTPASTTFGGGSPMEFVVSAEASGTMAADPAGGRDVDQTIHADFTMNSTGQKEDFSGSAEIRVVSGTIYADILSLPNLGFFDPASLENKWLSIPINTSTASLAQSFAGFQASGVPSTTFSAADMQKLLAAAEGAVGITKTLPDGTIGGVSDYHYAYTLNESGVENLANTFITIESRSLPSSEAAYSASTTAETDDQIASLFGSVTSLGGEMWIGKNDHYPHQVTFSLAFATSTSGGSTSETFGATSTVTDLNGSQSVEVPTGAVDFQTALQSMFSGGAASSPGFATTQEDGRDARRISDLHEIQNGLELYYNACGDYPGGPSLPSSGCSGTVASTFPAMKGALINKASLGIYSVPNDPSAGATYYYGTNAAGSAYVMAARLEDAANPIFKGYAPPSLAGIRITGIASCAAPVYCVSL